ncbi:probable serine/threonine-protein kinase yakA isoform X6 [Drosophila bipectinata]|uniref:probable serine/threonine-protein kinase yakA isoform X6 n=2 Tax=Drosophila bipectinata TaxID=42026 RepID=UPI001C89D3FF|nr:uncharacterized protein LOC108119507 isoform X7 [Drosophila bipectinata]
MTESGIDLGFDMEFDLNISLLNDNESMELLPNITVAGSSENVEFYELKSSRSIRSDEVPSFKNATPTSRTQLKLQLQREQHQQQQQVLMQQQVLDSPNQKMNVIFANGLRRNESELISTGSNSGSSFDHITNLVQKERIMEPSSPVKLKVPLQSIGVDVPPQVLQVSTVLENPTRYHVIQKQKNQVRQYLSESFRPSIWSCHNSEIKAAVFMTSSRNLQTSSVENSSLTVEIPNRFRCDTPENRIVNSNDSMKISPFGGCFSTNDSSNISEPLSLGNITQGPDESPVVNPKTHLSLVKTNSCLNSSINNRVSSGINNSSRISSTASSLQSNSAPLSPSLSSVATSASEAAANAMLGNSFHRSKVIQMICLMTYCKVIRLISIKALILNYQ